MKFEVADGLNMCTILVLLQEGHPEEKGFLEEASKRLWELSSPQPTLRAQLLFGAPPCPLPSLGIGK